MEHTIFINSGSDSDSEVQSFSSTTTVTLFPLGNKSKHSNRPRTQNNAATQTDDLKRSANIFDSMAGWHIKGCVLHPKRLTLSNETCVFCYFLSDDSDEHEDYITNSQFPSFSESQKDDHLASEMYQTPVESRPENTSPNLHLHMHHICPCLNMVYPYGPPTPYRPAPICYTHNRPLNLHHYQYTQYNMNMMQYATPAAVLSPQVLAVSATSHFNNANSEVVFGPPPRDRRNVERAGNTDNQENAPSEEKQDRAPVASNEDAATSQDVQEASNPCSLSENFVKFLEESCVRAEQIAYRNRNRPCFRNIQNLCMRTRSEILKPCTTISNIHSQGIPWATKDFIYAFIRLINCWHILKGYLEKDGGLGKIEKELTPEFKTCYYKWEKDSMQLAEQLRRIFCNLDATISGNSQQHNQDSNQNQLNRPTNDASITAQASCSGAVSKEPKVSRDGAVHIPSTSSEQVNLCDSYSSSTKEDDSGSDSRVYMKPGSYNVPKKNGSSNNSPRSFEFLETAQNTHIRRTKDKSDSVDKIWQNAQTAAPNLISKINPIGFEKSLESKEEANMQDLFPVGTDVQTWINTGLYPVLNETKQHQSLNGPKNLNAANSSQQKPITVLQRSRSLLLDGCRSAEPLDLTKNSFKDGFQRPYKKAVGDNCSESTQSKSSNSRMEIPSRTYRKRFESSESKLNQSVAYGDRNIIDEEGQNSDMTKDAMPKLKKILDTLISSPFSAYLPQAIYSVSFLTIF